MRDPETIEEELALFAEAMKLVDPFPEPKKRHLGRDMPL